MQFIIKDLVADGAFSVKLKWDDFQARHFEMHLYPDCVCFTKLVVPRHERRRIITTLTAVTDAWLNSVLDLDRCESRLISDRPIDVVDIDDMRVEGDEFYSQTGKRVADRTPHGALSILRGVMSKTSIIQLLRQDLSLSTLIFKSTDKKDRTLDIPYEEDSDDDEEGDTFCSCDSDEDCPCDPDECGVQIQ